MGILPMGMICKWLEIKKDDHTTHPPQDGEWFEVKTPHYQGAAMYDPLTKRYYDGKNHGINAATFQYWRRAEIKSRKKA